MKTYHSDRLGQVTVPDAAAISQMQDAEYYALQNQLYEAKAAELIADGYKRVKDASLYKWLYTKDDETLAIVRELSSTEWYTEQV